MFINGHSQEERQSWDVPVREGLDDHAEFQQSRRSREQLHSGRLKFEQSANVATLVKQDSEAQRIVKEREPKQRIACGISMQKERHGHPSSSSSVRGSTTSGYY